MCKGFELSTWYIFKLWWHNCFSNLYFSRYCILVCLNDVYWWFRCSFSISSYNTNLQFLIYLFIKSFFATTTTTLILIWRYWLCFLESRGIVRCFDCRRLMALLNCWVCKKALWKYSQFKTLWKAFEQCYEMSQMVCQLLLNVTRKYLKMSQNNIHWKKNN